MPISGFTAVPNPMMLSFLATQGFAIMYYGGAGWQFGKRKVSGMSNEEVNAMTPNDFLLKLHSETKTMVPTMAQGMKDMTPLITTTIEQFGSYIREAIAAFPQAVQNVFEDPNENKLVNPAGGFAVSALAGVGTLSTFRPGLTKYMSQVRGGTIPAGLTYDEYLRLTGQSRTADVNTDAFRKEAAREQARFERDKRLLERQHIAQIRTDARKADVSKFQRRRSSSFIKRKAGQSQKLERSRLITFVNKQRGYLLVFNKLPKPLSVIHKAKRDRIVFHITDSKRRLALLVQRYQF